MPSLNEIYNVLKGKEKLNYDYRSFSNDGMYKAFIGLMDRVREAPPLSSKSTSLALVRRRATL